MALRVSSVTFLSYLSGLFLFFSNSKVLSFFCGKEEKGDEGERPYLLWFRSLKEYFEYLSHVLSVCSSVCFSPLDFTRVPLHLEVLVAFRPTEPENLQKNKTCNLITIC